MSSDQQATTETEPEAQSRKNSFADRLPNAWKWILAAGLILALIAGTVGFLLMENNDPSDRNSGVDEQHSVSHAPATTKNKYQTGDEKPTKPRKYGNGYGYDYDPGYGSGYGQGGGQSYQEPTSQEQNTEPENPADKPESPKPSEPRPGKPSDPATPAQPNSPVQPAPPAPPVQPSKPSQPAQPTQAPPAPPAQPSPQGNQGNQGNQGKANTPKAGATSGATGGN